MKIHLITDYNAQLLSRAVLKELIVRSNVFGGKSEVTTNNYHTFGLDFNRIFLIPDGQDYVFFDFSLATLLPTYSEYFINISQFKLEVKKLILSFLNHFEVIGQTNQELVVFEPQESTSVRKHCFSRSSNFYCERHLLNYFFLELQEYCGHLKNLSFLYRQGISTSLRSSLVFDAPFDHASIKAQKRLMLDLITSISKPKLKVVCVDLDNTLWGGEVGELGSRFIELGGLTGRGRAYKLIQIILKRLSSQGVLLAVISKNTPELALEALKTHPEMVLREEDFVSTKIGWGSKATAIYELSQELNLGLESFLLLDDSPQEREEVTSLLPNVIAPNFETPYELIEILLNSPLLTMTDVTQEDLNRLSTYRNNHARERYLDSSHIAGSCVATVLGSSIQAVSTLDNFTRCLQLLNKTNQFNAISRRYSEAEFERELSKGGRGFFSFRGHDKFGDYGIISVVSLSNISKGVYRMEDWVLSCRAIGKGMEEAIISFLLSHLSIRELEIMVAVTTRNAPIRAFYERCGLLLDGCPVRVKTENLLAIFGCSIATVREGLEDGV